MELQRLKEIINKSGFSPEILKRLNEILDLAINRGCVTRPEKAEMLELIDIEIEAANIEADVLEDVALALECFADEIEKSQNLIEKDLDAISEAFDFDVDQSQKSLSNQ